MVKIVQPVKIKAKIKDDIMAVHIPKALLSALHDHSLNFFLDLKELNRLGIKSLSLKSLTSNNKFRRYVYYESSINSLSNKICATKTTAEQDRGWDELSSLWRLDSINLLASKGFNKDNLYYFWQDAYLFYKFRSDLPITRPYYIDYIGNVTNEYYDLKKAKKILENDTRVSKIKHVDIPYYNATRESNKAIEFVVTLPQEEFNELVGYYRDKKKEEYWSVRVRDCLASKYSLEPFDVLGLRAALRSQ